MLRWETGDVLSPTPFLIFYLAWVGAAAFGGLGPGLLATVASWVCVDFLFDTTPGQFDFTDPASIGRLVVLLAGGLAISLVGEKMRRGRIRERRQGRKLAELAQLTNLAPLLILDERDRIVSWSDGCATLYGFTAEQAIGRVSHELLRTEFPQPLEAIHAILHETRQWEGELTHRRADGAAIHVASLWVLRDGTSNPAVLEVDNDITPRKRAEEALRQSEEFNRRLIESSFDCIKTLDLEGNLLSMSSGGQLLLEIEDLRPLLNTCWIDFWKEQDRPRVAEAVAAARAGGVGRFQAYCPTFTGKPKWWDVVITPIRDTSGQVERLLSISRDITERKQAEETLRESEERYHRLFDDDLTGNFLCTPEGQILLCNPAFARMFGFSSVEEAVGTSMLELYVDPRERQPLLETLRQQGKIEGFGAWRKRRDGRPIYIVENLVGHFNDRGELSEVQGYIVDDTERKRAEEALRERMKELGCLYAVSRDMQEDFSMDELCRRAVEHLVPAMQFPEIAVPVMELNGKRFTPENYAEGLSHGLHAEISVEGEVLGHLRVYYAQERPFLIPEEQNLVNGVAEALSTWLEHKQAEEALRESEEKYRRIVETAMEGIVMVDADARTVFVNDRWSEIFGYSLEEARHMTHFDLVFPEDMAEMQARWESRKRGRKESYEFRFRRKDGRPIWALIGVAPRLDPEGRFLGTLVMIADITERKQAEEALRELNATIESKVAQRTAELEDRAKQLQKLTLDLSEAENRERKRLAEILHDDLQQVLAAAKFHLGLVSSRCKDDETSQETTEQVRQLLVEAIAKSRSLSHELSPPGLAHSDLRETFEWLADQMQTKHGLTVHVDVRHQIVLQSEPLKALLFKAAQEMLFNVIKHTQVQEARLRLRRRRENICLAVSDKGRGFDPQGLGSSAGSGLLSIRERLNLLGGRMKIRSAKGKGSTFLIVVPDSPQQTGQTDLL